MVKIVVFIMMLTFTTLDAQDSFRKNCVECHKALPSTLQSMFKRYLLLYSGEMNLKAGLKHYLKNPSRNISAMQTLFIETYGIKKKTTLSEKELDEAIDIYWDKYKVFNKLR